jgi:hypothetical protein
MKIPPRNASAIRVIIWAICAACPSNTSPITMPSMQNGMAPATSTPTSRPSRAADKCTWPSANAAMSRTASPGMIIKMACASLTPNQAGVEIGDTRSWRIQPLCRSRASWGPLANMADPIPEYTAMETRTRVPTARFCAVPFWVP